MYRIRILLIVCVLALGSFILPVFAGKSVMTSANLLPNGKPSSKSGVGAHEFVSALIYFVT